MAIEKISRKDGIRYRAVVRLFRKKQSRTFGRKVDAEAWEAEMLSGRNPRSIPEPLQQESQWTVRMLRRRFERDHASVRQSPSTQKLEAALYANYVDKELGSDVLCRLNQDRMMEYLLHLSQEVGLSNNRVNRVRKLLHCLFNQGVNWGVIASNPIRGTRPFPERSYIGDENINFLTQDEARSLLDWLQENDTWAYPKVRALLNTGARFGELVALRVRDFVPSPTGGSLIISRTYCRHTQQIMLRTKGNKARTIPLGFGMAALLADQAKGRNPDAPLLWDEWGESRHQTKFNKHFWKALRESRVRRIRVHDLRHTFAVHFLENGGQLYDLQKLLGHSTIRLTERYSHFSRAMWERSRGLVDHHANPEESRPAPTVIDGGSRPKMSHKCPTEQKNRAPSAATKGNSVSVSH